MKPLPILMDNCILSLSETMQPMLKKDKIVVNGKSYPYQFIGYKRKPKPGSEEKWKIHQINCLPTIAKIAREEKIELFTYNELRHEAWKKPNSFPSNIIGDIFSDINFKDVDAAVERTYLFSGDSDYIFSKEQVIKFCKWLLNPNIKEVANQLAKQNRFPSFLIQNLRNAERYQTLCENLSEEQYIDAFHLWTAEVNDLNLFLTTDKTFINVMTRTKNVNLNCRPISPSQLLSSMNIDKLEPFKYSEKEFYTIFDNPS